MIEEKHMKRIKVVPRLGAPRIDRALEERVRRIKEDQWAEQVKISS